MGVTLGVTLGVTFFFTYRHSKGKTVNFLKMGAMGVTFVGRIY